MARRRRSLLNRSGPGLGVSAPTPAVTEPTGSAREPAAEPPADPAPPASQPVDLPTEPVDVLDAPDASLDDVLGAPAPAELDQAPEPASGAAPDSPQTPDDVAADPSWRPDDDSGGLDLELAWGNDDAPAWDEAPAWSEADAPDAPPPATPAREESPDDVPAWQDAGSPDDTPAWLEADAPDDAQSPPDTTPAWEDTSPDDVPVWQDADSPDDTPAWQDPDGAPATSASAEDTWGPETWGSSAEPEEPTWHDGQIDIELDPDHFADISVAEPEPSLRESAAASYHSEAPTDTTDDGWDSSVWGPDTPAPPPPVMARAGAALLARGQRTKPPEPEPPAEPLPKPPSLARPAPMPDDFFMSDFDDDPPTEERPSAIPTSTNVSQDYRAPISVPEPPPLPGILDRFTPAPISERTESRPGRSRPSYVPTPIQQPSRDLTPHHAASRVAASADPPAHRTGEQAAVRQRGRSPVLLAGLIGTVMAVVITAGLVFGLWFSGIIQLPGSPEPPDSPDVPVTTDPAIPPADPVTDPSPPTNPVADPTQTEPKPVLESEPDPEPLRVEPEPLTQAPVEVQPEPEPEPAATGTLKIRSNRRVLIMVNGVAAGYPPLDLQREAGTYQVSAALGGRPETRQTVAVDITTGNVAPVSFNF